MNDFLDYLKMFVGGVITVGLIVLLIAGCDKSLKDGYYRTTIVYKDYIAFKVEAEVRFDYGLFESPAGEETLLLLIQEVITELSFDDIINHPDKIAREVKRRYDASDGAKLESFYIRVDPPLDFSAASQRLKSLPMTLEADSIISEAAKRDAKGYTPEAERLEERRDARQRIESNERIKIRQAKAIENAADNMGVLSGDLSVSLGN